MPNIESFSPDDKARLVEFVQFQVQLYKSDGNFVPPMEMDILGNKLLGVHGLLTSEHPFHSHALVRYFIIRQDKAIVGRIAACVNHSYNDYHHSKTGFFGFFEVIEDFAPAKMLLDSAINWIKDQGMTEVLGPLNFSTNESAGLLIMGHEHLPFMETPYNKIYYQGFIEQYGFVKAKDLYAQLMPVKNANETTKRHERLARITDRLKRENEISIRPIQLNKDFVNDIRLMRYIYNDAWSDNWGFVPISEDEMIHAAQNMKIVADPGLINFGYVKGEIAGFIGSIPDVYEMIGGKGTGKSSDYLNIAKIFLKRRKVKRVRLMLFGILKKYQKIGLDAILYHESFKNAHEKSYEECEISWLLEDNPLVIKAGESMGGKHYKTWRIYQFSIT